MGCFFSHAKPGDIVRMKANPPVNSIIICDHSNEDPNNSFYAQVKSFGFDFIEFLSLER